MQCVSTKKGQIMKILIADDDAYFRDLLEKMLVKWGYDMVAARDGKEAWQALQADDAPRIAILDWLMPEMDGLELCRKVRKEMPEPYTYIILLTSKQQDEDLVSGMEAGADDYLTKPLKTNELRVRLNAGRRIIELQNELAAHAAELEAANKDLEAFSYAVSDDLLKSLLTIGDHARAIQDVICGKDDKECRSYTKRIYDKIRHLGELIGVMHDFFRPTREAGLFRARQRDGFRHNAYRQTVHPFPATARHGEIPWPRRRPRHGRADHPASRRQGVGRGGTGQGGGLLVHSARKWEVETHCNASLGKVLCT